MNVWPLKKQDAQVFGLQANEGFLFLSLLLHPQGGWSANHALQRTRPSRSGCNPRVPRTGSLSLCR